MSREIITASGLSGIGIGITGVANLVRTMYHGVPIRTVTLAAALHRSEGAVEDLLRRAARQGLLACVSGRGWAPG
ncbi:hypothetical protein [Caldimonas sp.]|uniref:hypothetical protein n=1 Tax=Caldimonas sp. TaxID=2838790 RepID=UPI00391B567E